MAVHQRAAYPEWVRGWAYTFGVLVGLWSTSAYAELVARSRNSVVFVESAREGEEWKAFRTVDAGHPAIYRVQGPGRVLLTVRTLSRVEPTFAVASVLDGNEVLMTLQVPATEDKQANLTDGGARPSLAKVYLLRVEQGLHRITVRHSQGPVMLVSARFAPPLSTEGGLDGVGLVAPGPSVKPDVPRVGRLVGQGNSLAAGPVKPRLQDRPIQAPLPDGDADESSVAGQPASKGRSSSLQRGPTIEVENSDAPADDRSVVFEPRPWVHPARVLLEVRGGLLIDPLVTRPGATIGFDLRGAVSGENQPRRLSLGLSLDLSHASGQDILRFGGAAVDVAEVRHTHATVTADARVQLLRFAEQTSVYGSLGGGALMGRARVGTSAGARSAKTVGLLASARLGATLGVRGDRPFLELRTWAGRFSSRVVRPGPADPDAAVAWFAVAAMIGWRIEVGAGDSR